ncbi:type II toxin-antitoxin system VapC family toxin [Sphingomonas sp. TZW2008]|uniref:type II toxin-antitoxin system VapC family toxin n=1 Tax=Sphingomonas sp. TZW2008 TaxID=1917973 RepID=UPI000A270114|nr:type II toxin-antitoxin system VapC family toxin [Sphingomonas sp. TZW2008]
MIVDTSVLICLLREEPDHGRFVHALAESADEITISAANYLETAIVIDANNNPALSERFDAVIEFWHIAVAPVTPEQARLARTAYRQFGKGRHPAALNFGDCFAYALAKETGRPLLYKGADFTRTDVTPAA